MDVDSHHNVLGNADQLANDICPSQHTDGFDVSKTTSSGDPPQARGGASPHPGSEADLPQHLSSSDPHQNCTDSQAPPDASPVESSQLDRATDVKFPPQAISTSPPQEPSTSHQLQLATETDPPQQVRGVGWPHQVNRGKVTGAQTQSASTPDAVQPGASLATQSAAASCEAFMPTPSASLSDAVDQTASTLALLSQQLVQPSYPPGAASRAFPAAVPVPSAALALASSQGPPADWRAPPLPQGEGLTTSHMADLLEGLQADCAGGVSYQSISNQQVTLWPARLVLFASPSFWPYAQEIFTHTTVHCWRVLLSL